MRPLRSGDEVQLSWSRGSVDCHAVAVAGAYVLLRPRRAGATPVGPCSLIYLDGMVPVGFDGVVDPGADPSELRFRVTDRGRVADRRTAVRIPCAASVLLAVGGDAEPAGEAAIMDVSAGGMRLRRPGRIPSGTPVRVRAELPGGPVIDADAIVRASEPGICSVEYTTLHSSSREEIGAWTVGVLRSALAAA